MTSTTRCHRTDAWVSTASSAWIPNCAATCRHSVGVGGGAVHVKVAASGVAAFRPSPSAGPARSEPPRGSSGERMGVRGLTSSSSSAPGVAIAIAGEPPGSHLAVIVVRVHDSKRTRTLRLRTRTLRRRGRGLAGRGRGLARRGQRRGRGRGPDEDKGLNTTSACRDDGVHDDGVQDEDV